MQIQSDAFFSLLDTLMMINNIRDVDEIMAMIKISIIDNCSFFEEKNETLEISYFTKPNEFECDFYFSTVTIDIQYDFIFCSK